MEEDIKKHIEETINSGATKEEVKKILKDSGWDDDKIKTVFSELYPEESSQEAQAPSSPLPLPSDQLQPESQFRSELEQEPEAKPQIDPKPKIEQPQFQQSSYPNPPRPPEPPKKSMEFPRPEITGEEIASCKHCGTPLKKNATYCPYCGKTVTSSMQEPLVKPTLQESSYNGQQQSQQQYPQPMEDKSNLATASLVFGILSIFGGFITGIVGLILGAKGLKSSKRGLAIAGIVMSVVFGIISTIVILAGIVLASLGNASTRANDARIMAAMNQLRTSAQTYYSSRESYEGLESDFQILQVKEDIEEVGGKNFAMNIKDNAYCAEVMQSSGEWWCVDSNLKSEEYEIDPVCSENKYSCE